MTLLEDVEYIKRYTKHGSISVQQSMERISKFISRCSANDVSKHCDHEYRISSNPNDDRCYCRFCGLMEIP